MTGRTNLEGTCHASFAKDKVEMALCWDGGAGTSAKRGQNCRRFEKEGTSVQGKGVHNGEDVPPGNMPCHLCSSASIT